MLSQPKLLLRNIIARQIDVYPPTNNVAVKKDIAIPMSDGIVLYANHYSPKATGDFPTVLIRSPWGRGLKRAPFSLLYGYVAQRFAERGYYVILQDVRNAENSPTTQMMPHENEVQDGKDTIHWLVKQPWFNGKLGLWGASYLGYVQWAALAGELPQIEKVAMVPVTTSTRWFTIFHPNGSLALDTLFRLQYTSAITGYALPKLFGAIRKQERILTEQLNQLPLTEAIKPLPKVPGFDFEAVMDMPDFHEPIWQKIDLRDKLDNNSAHIHLIAGWYDIFLEEQLEDYFVLKQAGKDPYLTIGPWHHTSQDLGAYTIRTSLAWFDKHLKCQEAPSSPVTIYVQGTDTWRDLEYWPPDTTEMTYFLDREHSLSVVTPGFNEETDHYRYDPLDPTPSIGGPVLNPKPGQHDNRDIESRADVITYDTAELSHAIEIVGTPTATLFVGSTCKHTDFFVRLCDVQADGRSLNVTDNLVRMQQEDEDLATKQEIEVKLWPTAYHFAKGHKIRVQIASGAYPRWNRNLGGGEPIVSGQAAKVAEQTIYYGLAYPSRIVLPVFTKSTPSNNPS
jgi:putative CocE/NonD family hydrolase